MLTLETRISGQNSLHRNAGGDRRGDVIDWHTRSTDHWGAAQDLRVHDHNALGCLKTLQPFLHFFVERGQEQQKGPEMR